MLTFSTFLTRQRITMDIRNHQVGIDRQFGLKGGGTISERQGGPTGRTLKIWRILLRSTFQVAMVSLSFFAWKSRKAEFLPLCSMTFLWISATVLRLRTW